MDLYLKSQRQRSLPAHLHHITSHLSPPRAIPSHPIPSQSNLLLLSTYLHLSIAQRRIARRLPPLPTKLLEQAIYPMPETTGRVQTCMLHAYIHTYIYLSCSPTLSQQRASETRIAFFLCFFSFILYIYIYVHMYNVLHELTNRFHHSQPSFHPEQR